VITIDFEKTEKTIMNYSLKTLIALTSIASAILCGSPAFAETPSTEESEIKGLNNSYVGAGVSSTITRASKRSNENRNFGGNVQGRFAIPNAPVSVRGTFLFNSQNSTIIPTLTYDLPVSNGTNLYAGAGYSFVRKDGTNTPIGNRDSFVLNAGIEAKVGNTIVVYGDAKYGIKAYQNSAAPALSLSTGVGLRF
jgi:hypothetical protein